MKQNNEGDKSNPLLGMDVWQLWGSKIEQIKKLLPDNPKLEKLIQIAQVLDKYQKEIVYYQTRIKRILQNLEKN